ncbi:hypothetical protein [Teredinibacter haidensis]|uniref:hypothetical protein n=1 Tax=Teredinibacter haidensis TaxID=2731755 RepID=UPI0009491B2C|nr:hypothetical protein [Teredinibacter haidensis]
MTLFQSLPYAALAAVLAFSALVTHAETVQMPKPDTEINASNDTSSIPVPRRGMSKSDVESTFGSPESRDGPNGTPPIYYWEYPKFTVYFESDYVIHTVRKYK